MRLARRRRSFGGSGTCCHRRLFCRLGGGSSCLGRSLAPGGISLRALAQRARECLDTLLRSARVCASPYDDPCHGIGRGRLLMRPGRHQRGRLLTYGTFMQRTYLDAHGVQGLT